MNNLLIKLVIGEEVDSSKQATVFYKEMRRRDIELDDVVNELMTFLIKLRRKEAMSERIKLGIARKKAKVD